VTVGRSLSVLAGVALAVAAGGSCRARPKAAEAHRQGDPCPAGPPVTYACSADRSFALVCRDSRFDVWRRCRGSGACSVLGEEHLHCDTTVGEVGDPCERQGAFACSLDRLAMLECEGRAMVVASTCRGSLGCRFNEQGHTVDCADEVALEGDACNDPNRITCSVDGKSELVCSGRAYARKRECRRTDCRIDGNALYCD